MEITVEMLSSCSIHQENKSALVRKCAHQTNPSGVRLMVGWIYFTFVPLVGLIILKSHVLSVHIRLFLPIRSD